MPYVTVLKLKRKKDEGTLSLKSNSEFLLQKVICEAKLDEIGYDNKIYKKNQTHNKILKLKLVLKILIIIQTVYQI